MKQTIVISAIIAIIIIVFVGVDRKKYNRSNIYRSFKNESITNKQESIETKPRDRKAVTESATLPVEENPIAKNTAEEESVTDMMEPANNTFAEILPRNETQHKLNNVRVRENSVMKTNPKIVPIAVPIVTAEEAEKDNEQAIVLFEKKKESMVFDQKGMSLVYIDNITKYTPVKYEEKYDEIFKSRPDLSETRIPRRWSIDYKTLKGNCTFSEQKDGYEIKSPDGFLCLLAPAVDVQNTVTEVSIELSCHTQDTHVKLGIIYNGMYKAGMDYMKEIKGLHKKVIVNWEVSALEHYDNFRPFLEISGDVTIHSLRVYQKELKGVTYLEGEVVERSLLPNPRESDYPNCRFTMHFEGNIIKKGEPCPKNMVLIVNGFENYKKLGTDSLKKGEKVICAILPYETLSEDERSIQLADDLNLFTLDNYYTLFIRKIAAYSSGDNALFPVSGVHFLDEQKDYVSIFSRKINEPISQSLMEAQADSIAEDLRKVNELLNYYDDSRIQEINSKFEEAWKSNKQLDPPGYNRIGNLVWRNINNSFWTLPEEYTFLSKPTDISRSVLNGFLSLKKVCEANGVQLIVSLVPNLYTISSRVINPEFRDIPDLQTANYVKQLSEIGVETVYASDMIIKRFSSFPFAFFYPSNGHPGDTTQECLSDLLVNKLKRYDISVDLNSDLFSIKTEDSHVYGNPNFLFRFPEKCDIGPYKDGSIYKCRHVYYDNKLITRNKNASILILGNSYMETPMSLPEALPALIMLKTNSSVDWQRTDGNGPFSDILIQMLSSPNTYLSNKKVVIVQVGTDHIVSVSNKGTMLDIAQMDNELLLLNKRTKKGTLVLESNALPSQINDTELWGPLSSVDKYVFEIDNTGQFKYTFKLNQVVNLETGFSDTDPIVLVIPHVCAKTTDCRLVINGISKYMHSSNHTYNTRFFHLAYELPAGTKEITMTIEGEPGTLIAIKDIQVWQ